MANKKKKRIMEFRYYQMPQGSPMLALLGEKWIHNYGKQNWDRQHFHNYLEIGFCYYGEGDMELGNENYRFHGDQFTVIPPNFPHTTNSDPGNISRWEYLFVDVEGFLQGMFPDNAPKRQLIQKRIYAKALFLERKEHSVEAGRILDILNIMRDTQEFYLEEAKGILATLLIEIARINRGISEESNRVEMGRNISVVARSLDYVSSHYMEPIRVAELAEYNHLSEPHFRRVFSEYMDMSPLEYINVVRVRAACEHLKKTNESITDIAAKCGFPTISTFNRNFKQIMGETPLEWRKRRENYEQTILGFDILTEGGW